MSFRKEKKYRLTCLEFNIFKDSLIKKGMTSLYDSRIINSIYYDNQCSDMHYHSEEGVLPRKKVRVRWYKDPDNSSIETKVSSVEGRFKTTQSLCRSSVDRFPKMILDGMYGSLIPSLLVSYSREYYTINGMRVTFDSNISYKNLRQNVQSIFSDPERVMEVKVSIDTPEDFIEKLVPYPTARFSKYSRGLLISNREM